MLQYSFVDKALNQFDGILRILIPPQKRMSMRETPGQLHSESELTAKEKQEIAALMRINHTGEVCAQALYQGQALTAKLQDVKAQMQQAAMEEIDHLAWCEQRLEELMSRPSLLNPLWFSGSFLIGAFAGLAGDRWSLGFVAETERQVALHLQNHLNHLPVNDIKTKAILIQMKEDEEHHAAVAQEAGAEPLPVVIQQIMSIVSKLMIKSSYYI